MDEAETETLAGLWNARTSVLWNSILKWPYFNVGDIESMPFIEALGQFSYRVGNVSNTWDLIVYTELYQKKL